MCVCTEVLCGYGPGFGRAPVLLAVALDGTPLRSTGTQPVLPQDRCGGRYVSGVEAIRVHGGYRAWCDGPRHGLPAASFWPPGRLAAWPPGRLAACPPVLVPA